VEAVKVRTYLLLIICAGAVVACGTGDQDINLIQELVEDTGLAAEVGQPDVAVVPDTHVTPDPDIWVLELPPELPVEECAPGDGCFLDPCTENAACLSGWCVEHMGDGVCTQMCTEECPSGWSCQQVAGTDPDLVYVCVSQHANLCRPCTSGSDCKSTVGAEDVCVSYGAGGNFCGGACEVSQDCPWGFSCQDIETADGIPTRQCTSDAGVCPCTPKSVELALWTTCSVTSEWGTCEGMRVCTEEGLTDCDAGAPVAESCDGLDNDCDGEVDEPVLVEGVYAELCDDDNDCTLDLCKGSEGCSHEGKSEGECVDGDACSVGDHCEEGQCVGLPIACDDDNPCTDDLCDGAGGCAVEFNTADCDDGDPCTVNDTCDEGTCAGFPVDCACQADEDCAQFDDDDLCNGTLACELSTFPYQCKVDLETVVICGPETPGEICSKTVCVPETGECVVEPNHEGYACDDGDACTVGDKCEQGMCLAGVPMACADNNPCTDDSCDPLSGCTYTNNDSPCNDLDTCTTGDICDGGQCVGGPPPDCDDSNGCTDDGCDPGLGCTHTPNQAPCDDGNACTVGDECKAGYCANQGPAVCDDANPCTDDSCAPGSGCLYQHNEASCNDGDPCTLDDQCELGVCAPGVPVNCNDGNPCTDDTCGPFGGCLYQANDDFCDDGNPCTLDDQCAGGQCVSSGAQDCDDGNPCTTDLCDPVDGCIYLHSQAPCTDGDPCTVNDQCENGECAPGPVVKCDDGNPCTADACEAPGVCVHTPEAGECDDGNECTLGDKCEEGACVYSSLEDCDDGNVCTTDSCDPAEGCTHTLNEAPCTDADVCTLGDHCHLGECISSGTMSCSDGNPCTDDICDPAGGCFFQANNAPCDDGNACTEEDTCAEGWCATGVPSDCDDDNLCTDDSCDDVEGCIHTPNDVPCDDGNQCTINDQCGGGDCLGGGELPCQDGNVCTEDGCDPDLGCTFIGIPGECSDDNDCTSEDSCVGGMCQGGPELNCDDQNECTDDSCIPDGGCSNLAVADGTPCQGGPDFVCSGGVCDTCPAGSQTFEYTGGAQTFTPPGCVSSVRVAVVGGGGGGAGSHYGGGGSGYVLAGTYNVAGPVTVTVGAGGGGGVSGTNNAPGSKGSNSSFGGFLSASGGNGGNTNGPGGGNGGSGGGGAGNSGCAGKGGSGGSSGESGCSYGGGSGGHFDDLSMFVVKSLTAGAGGAAGQSSHSGGGGAGGMLINGSGPNAGNGGASWSGKGGQGYGAGGGGGGYNGSRPTGGAGAHGVVHVEW